MRRASQQALSVPAFRSSMDCTPWVLGGLWPSDLQQVNSGTAPLAEYLKKDLQRIADSANDRLRAIAEAGLDESVRQAEESRVINVARAFAVLRVESTVRQLRREPLGFQPEKLSLTGRTAPPPARPATEPEPELALVPPVAAGRHRSDRTDNEVLVPLPSWSDGPRIVDVDDIHDAVDSELMDADADADADPAPAAPVEVVDVPAIREEPTPPPAPVSAKADEHALQRVLRFVARQEPSLRWAVGATADDTVVLATDVAHGWIPPGINLPEGVELPEPQRRTGSAASMLGDVETAISYAPGSAFGGFADRDQPAVSTQPRRLDPIDDLDQALVEATRQRDGLPRLTHALASTAVSGARVNDAEVDVLRVHLDTARYQVTAQYPDVDNGLLLNCLLLAATEALVTGDRIAANYHFAWFGVLSGPPAARWGAQD